MIEHQLALEARDVGAIARAVDTAMQSDPVSTARGLLVVASVLVDDDKYGRAELSRAMVEHAEKLSPEMFALQLQRRRIAAYMLLRRSRIRMH